MSYSVIITRPKPVSSYASWWLAPCDDLMGYSTIQRFLWIYFGGKMLDKVASIFLCGVISHIPQTCPLDLVAGKKGLICQDFQA